MLILAKIGVFAKIDTLLIFSWLFHENLILKTKLLCSPYIYIGVQNIFSRFSAFLGPKVEMLAYNFFDLKPFMTTK